MDEVSRPRWSLREPASFSGGQAFQGRVRLYLGVRLARLSFFHLVLVVVRSSANPSWRVLLEPDARRRLATILGGGGLVALASWRRLSRSNLFAIDIAATLMLSASSLLSVALRPSLAPRGATRSSDGGSVAPSPARRRLAEGSISVDHGHGLPQLCPMVTPHVRRKMYDFSGHSPPEDPTANRRRVGTAPLWGLSRTGPGGSISLVCEKDLLQIFSFREQDAGVTPWIMTAETKGEGRGLLTRYQAVRSATESLAAPLSPEDQGLQSMPDCSPTKWHRAHTTWFFEEFILGPRGRPAVDPRYRYLFNSYYEAVGPRHARPQRGLLSRPSADEITAYRRAVDGRMIELLSGASGAELEAMRPLLELGLAHEEQHQELLLTDILHALSMNPLLPAYRSEVAASPAASEASPPLRYVEHGGGLVEVGARGSHFFFDNEGPRHRSWLEPFALATRLITVGEVRAFIDAKGYETPSLWLSAGLDFVRKNQLLAPLHTRYEDGVYQVFTLDGLREARDSEPASHLSYYEADAVARFLGARLPTEIEWEVFASTQASDVGNFRESNLLRPAPAPEGQPPAQLFGDVWEWTSSAYAPYPGFATAPGAVGEYNGKFMVNQLVLRGGSCFTPRGHLRATYRNFWPADTRFQMTGARLARSR